MKKIHLARYQIIFTKYTDKSKYGYRMLQQMGWKEGKGLGAREDGDTEHIRIKKKEDNKGTIKREWEESKLHPDTALF